MIELTRISAQRLRELPRDQTVFFFPVGVLEDHGPHLPLGMDAWEARKLCEIAAERLERDLPGWVGVVMPEAPLAVEANTTAIAFPVRPHVLRDWLVDAVEPLVRLHFTHFVCFSGTAGPRQLTAIEEAGRIVARRYGMKRLRAGFGFFPHAGARRFPTLVSASSALASLDRVKASPFWPDAVEHGGARDSSVGLALAPSVVTPGQVEAMPPVQRSLGYWSRFQSRVQNRTSGYWGDPASGSREKGEQELLQTVDDVFPKLRAVWDGADGNNVFRSWYSALPPNKSFFKAWALTAALVLLMCFWVYFSLSGLTAP